MLETRDQIDVYDRASIFFQTWTNFKTEQNLIWTNFETEQKAIVKKSTNPKKK
jgi:hypothetical protein